MGVARTGIEGSRVPRRTGTRPLRRVVVFMAVNRISTKQAGSFTAIEGRRARLTICSRRSLVLDPRGRSFLESLKRHETPARSLLERDFPD